MRAVAESLGRMATNMYILGVISLMSAGVYVCCLVGGLSLRARQP